MQSQDDYEAYRALFRYSSLGIIISNSEGVIEQINPFANDLFGYEDNELIGQKIEVLLPQRFKGGHVQRRSDYNANPKARAIGIGMDLLALKKNGTEFPVEISLAHYEANGKTQIMSFITDITERKKTMEELKKLNVELEKKVSERTIELSEAIMELQHTNEHLNYEMEQRKKAEEELWAAFEKEKELSELKSRFVSMASHEFRTPLSGILSSVSLIAKYQSASDEDKRNRHIQTIKTSVQHLTNILNDFLSLDKLEEGKIKCYPSVFSIVDFTKELVDEMHALFNQDNRIVYEHQGDVVLISLDKDMLRNVLINLLSNAMKYSKATTKINFITEVRNEKLTITARAFTNSAKEKIESAGGTIKEIKA